MRDRVGHFSFPFFFTQQRQAWNAEIVFDDVAVRIRQVAELERHQGLVPHQRGAETSSESQKEHAPSTVTAECLDGRIVDQAYRHAQGSGEIETNPPFAQMSDLLRCIPCLWARGNRSTPCRISTR